MRLYDVWRYSNTLRPEMRIFGILHYLIIVAIVQTYMKALDI